MNGVAPRQSGDRTGFIDCTPWVVMGLRVASPRNYRHGGTVSRPPEYMSMPRTDGLKTSLRLDLKKRGYCCARYKPRPARAGTQFHPFWQDNPLSVMIRRRRPGNEPADEVSRPVFRTPLPRPGPPSHETDAGMIAAPILPVGVCRRGSLTAASLVRPDRISACPLAQESFSSSDLRAADRSFRA